MKKRAVITGLGIVSPIGIGKAENWKNLVDGQSGVDKLKKLDSGHLPVKIGAEVKNFDPMQIISDRKAIRLTYYNVHLALAAAKLAFEDSGLEKDKIDPVRFGGIVGSGGGGFDDGPGVDVLQEPILKSWDEEKQRFDSAKFGEKGLPSAHPLFLLKALPNNAFYYISLFYNIQGENDNIVTSYTGGSQAIGDAFRCIRRGLADVVIAGGYDSLITPNTIFSLDTFNLLSKKENPKEACRPFDSSRDGMVAADGAAFFIVEEFSHARSRGADIYAEITGYGNTSSAFQLYDPDPSGNAITRAALRALEDAEVSPDSVDWICADGIGTLESDRAEARAIKNVFKQELPDVLVSATKSVTGHMGTGAGAAESVYSAMAISSGILPPTINCDDPDADCRLHFVPQSALEKNIKIAMNINQGIGGQSTALIFKKI